MVLVPRADASAPLEGSGTPLSIYKGFRESLDPIWIRSADPRFFDELSLTTFCSVLTMSSGRCFDVLESSGTGV